MSEMMRDMKTQAYKRVMDDLRQSIATAGYYVDQEGLFAVIEALEAGIIHGKRAGKIAEDLRHDAH